MKFILGLSALVAVAFGAALVVDKKALQKDIEDFLKLVPAKEVENIMLIYIENDAELKQLVQYYFSEEFKILLKELDNSPEAHAVYDYLEDAGLEIYDLINSFHKMVGLDPVHREFANINEIRVQSVTTGGFRGLAAELRKIMPYEEFEALYEKKMKEGGAYTEFIEAIFSPVFKKIRKEYYYSEPLQAIIKSMKAQGIDLVGLLELYCATSGIRNCPVSKLQ